MVFLATGTTYPFWATGMVVFGAVVYITNFKILIISNTYNVLSIFIIVFSIVFYYFNYIVISAVVPSFDIY